MSGKMEDHGDYAETVDERLAPIQEEEEDTYERTNNSEWRTDGNYGPGDSGHRSSWDNTDEVRTKVSPQYVVPDGTASKANPFSDPSSSSPSDPPRITRVASPRRDILRPGSSPLHRSYTPGGQLDMSSTGDAEYPSEHNDRIRDPTQSDSESDAEHQSRGRPRRLSHLALSHPRPISAGTMHRLNFDTPSTLRVPGQAAGADDANQLHPASPTATSVPNRALSSSPRRTTTPGGGSGSRSTSATGVKMVRQMSGVDTDITGPWFEHFARLTGNQIERLRAFKKSPMERRRNALIKAAHEVAGGWESLGPVIRKQMMMPLDELASKEARRSKSTSQSPVPKPRDRSTSRSRLGDSAISPPGQSYRDALFKGDAPPISQRKSKSRDVAELDEEAGASRDSVRPADQVLHVRTESKPLPSSIRHADSATSEQVTSASGSVGRRIGRPPNSDALHRKPRFKLNVISETPGNLSASSSSVGVSAGIPGRRLPRSARGDSAEPLQATGRRLRQRRHMLEDVDLESNDEDDTAMREVKRMARSAEAFQSRLSDSFNKVKEASYSAALDSLAVSLESIENETHPAFVAELKKLERQREQRHAAARHHLLLAERSVSATVKCERKIGRDTFKYAAHELRQVMHDDVFEKRNGLIGAMDAARIGLGNFGPHCGAWFRNENDQTTFGWDTQKHEWSSFLPESWRDDLDADLIICKSIEAGGTMAAQKAAELAARRYREREEAELAALRQIDFAAPPPLDRRKIQSRKPMLEPSASDLLDASNSNGGRQRKLSKKAQEAQEENGVMPVIVPKKPTVSMDRLLGGNTMHSLKRNDLERETAKVSANKLNRPYADVQYEPNLVQPRGGGLANTLESSNRMAPSHEDHRPRKKLKKVSPKDHQDGVGPTYRAGQGVKTMAVPQLHPPNNGYPPGFTEHPEVAMQDQRPFQGTQSRAPGQRDMQGNRSEKATTLNPSLSPVYERPYFPASNAGPHPPQTSGQRLPQAGTVSQDAYYNQSMPKGNNYMPYIPGSASNRAAPTSGSSMGGAVYQGMYESNPPTLMSQSTSIGGSTGYPPMMRPIHPAIQPSPSSAQAQPTFRRW